MLIAMHLRKFINYYMCIVLESVKTLHTNCRKLANVDISTSKRLQLSGLSLRGRKDTIVCCLHQYFKLLKLRMVSVITETNNSCYGRT